MSIKGYIKKTMKSNVCLTVYNTLNPRNKRKIEKDNFVDIHGATLNSVDILIRGKRNTVLIEPGCLLSNCQIRIYGNGNQIHIQKDCLVNGSTFWIEDDNGEISLEHNTTIDGSVNFSVIEGTCIYVESDCMFSSNIVLRTGDSHSIVNMAGVRTNPSKDIRIGSHTWIGEGAVCLKGCILPKHTIVGTRAVVTSQFIEEYTVLAGSPAKVVKREVDWIRQRVSC